MERDVGGGRGRARESRERWSDMKRISGRGFICIQLRCWGMSRRGGTIGVGERYANTL